MPYKNCMKAGKARLASYLPLYIFCSLKHFAKLVAKTMRFLMHKYKTTGVINLTLHVINKGITYPAHLQMHLLVNIHTR